jgi:cobalamin-dependent methionine synthase I
LLLDDRYDDIVLIAREQVEGGAHVLDVCCALTERPDEDEQMRELVRRLAQSIEAPLSIDSTEPKVLETALQNYPRPSDSQLGATSRRAEPNSTPSYRSRASMARRSSP